MLCKLLYLSKVCCLCKMPWSYHEVSYKYLPQSLILNEARFSMPQISLYNASPFLSNVPQMIHWPEAYLLHGAFSCLGAVLGTANLSHEGFQLIVLDLVDVIVPVSDALLSQLLSLP